MFFSFLVWKSLRCVASKPCLSDIWSIPLLYGHFYPAKWRRRAANNGTGNRFYLSPLRQNKTCFLSMFFYKLNINITNCKQCSLSYVKFFKTVLHIRYVLQYTTAPDMNPEHYARPSHYRNFLNELYNYH